MRNLSGRSPQSGLLYRAPLLSGEPGTSQTIRVMRQLIDQAVSDPEFVRFAIDAVRNVPEYDDYGELEAIWNFVKSSIRYTKDPFTKEKLYPPKELLQIGAGDCDDISMLIAAMAIALGYPAQLVTVAASAQDPNEFSHVYVEAEAPPGSGNWIALDCARPGARFGEEPPYYFRKRAWSMVDDSYTDLGGCGCKCPGSKLSGLAGYLALGDGIDYNALLEQGLQEIPPILAISEGGGGSVQTRQGVTSAAASPYGSFVTPYTPGYGIPQAGYPGVVAVSTGSAWLNSNWPWLAFGGFLLLALSGGKGRH